MNKPLIRLLGALAERNTFQGERCIYNALNDRIRNLLLQYDFSKSSDPYVYWSTHISTLLGRTSPKTTDITLASGSRSFDLHKFILVARSPYFRSKLAAVPETTTWKLTHTVPVQSFLIVLRYLYLGEVPRDIAPVGGADSEEDVLKGLDKVSKQLEVESLWEAILAGGDRRLARQRYQAEVERARGQFEDFFKQNVLGHKMVVDTDQVKDVKWKYDNSMFADVILRADEPIDIEDERSGQVTPTEDSPTIPIGPAGDQESVTKRKSGLYPAHKAMLIRSEYFEKMFSGDFVESQRDDHLRIITVDCTPAVLEIILTFLYTESTVCPLEHALDLLYAADMLFLDGLKSKAAQAISTLGSGNANALVDRTHGEAQKNGEDGPGVEDPEMEPINIYDVIHAAWDLRVQRLEEFAARYLAYRLEDYIDEEDFQALIAESAQRITVREETDTIELLDDIRYYLSDRFRLRFEDVGFEDMMDESGEMIDADLAAAMAQQADISADATNGVSNQSQNGVQANGDGEVKDGEAVRTLDGAEAEDEFASDAINYQILQRKIDAMLDRLKLDA
jgi:ankyrin repeat/BTB/POZ domain-containing protein 1